VTHDICVAMQNMAISLDNSSRALREGALREVFDGPVPVPSDTDWEPSEDCDDYCDPHFEDPYDMDTDNGC
jgi:hypothetical protein